MHQERKKQSSEVSRMAGLEDDLAAAIEQAADQIAHAECFDLEQRAEVYSILHALQADSAAHRQMLGQWVSDVTGAPCHV
jgi:hypothetical protein